jgi:glycosyltransferase involved in cell wall biosynthesis
LEKISNLTQVSTIYSTAAKSVPLVSVVITTKNEEKNIENCLRTIRNQTFNSIELIVIDNFSVDQTPVLARKYAAHIYSKGPERSSQRNLGAKVSNGKYILYLDADMVLSSGLIEECVEKCEHEAIDALYIPERIIGHGFWVKVRDFERSFYTGSVIDAVRFVRKDLFEKVNGFDEDLVGPEDWDFDKRLRQVGRTGKIHGELYHNEGKFNISHYLKKKQYYAGGIQEYVQKWARDEETVRQTGILYRFVGVFVEKGKWRKLVKHPILTMAMYYLRLRVAIRFAIVRSKNDPFN